MAARKTRVAHVYIRLILTLRPFFLFIRAFHVYLILFIYFAILFVFVLSIGAADITIFFGSFFSLLNGSLRSGFSSFVEVKPGVSINVIRNGISSSRVRSMLCASNVSGSEVNLDGRSIRLLTCYFSDDIFEREIEKRYA